MAVRQKVFGLLKNSFKQILQEKSILHRRLINAYPRIQAVKFKIKEKKEKIKKQGKEIQDNIEERSKMIKEAIEQKNAEIKKKLKSDDKEKDEK